jgi:hypothetical protein
MIVRLATTPDDELELLDDDELELLDDELELLDEDELELLDEELATVDPEELELLLVPPEELPDDFPPQATRIALVSNGRMNLQVCFFSMTPP